MSLAAAGISDHYHVLPFADEITGRQLSDTAFADVFQPMRVKFIKRFYCWKFGIVWVEKFMELLDKFV